MSLLDALIAGMMKRAEGENASALISEESTFIQGYLNTNDIIGSPDASKKEMTSDYIRIPEDAATLSIVYRIDEVPSGDSPWTAFRFYDAEKAIVGNRIADSDTMGGRVETEDGTYVVLNCYGPPSGAAFLRFSLRTFGGASVQLLAWPASGIERRLQADGRQLTGA